MRRQVLSREYAARVRDLAQGRDWRTVSGVSNRSGIVPATPRQKAAGGLEQRASEQEIARVEVGEVEIAQQDGAPLVLAQVDAHMVALLGRAYFVEA